MKSTEQLTLHGVFIDVLGVGVLLTGDPGIGKSEIALSLIDRGHALVADDAVTFSKHGARKLVGTCPEPLQDFLEVRGLGVLNIRAMYGDTAIKAHKRLKLIVKVVKLDRKALQQMDRLHGMHTEQFFLDVSIPEVTLPVTTGRHLSILVEAAVRNQILKSTGYGASQDFIDKHQIHISNEREK